MPRDPSDTTHGWRAGEAEPARYDQKVAEASERAQHTAFLQFLGSLVLMLGFVWVTAHLVYNWRGPSLAGVTAIASEAARRDPDPRIQQIHRRILAAEVYTLTELKDIAQELVGMEDRHDMRRVVDLTVALAAFACLLLLIRVGSDWWTERPVSVPWSSPIGVLDRDGRVIPHALPIAPLARLPLKRARRRLLPRDVAPLTPLAVAILERYAAYPQWPAASTGRHGDRTLLEHVLAVRERALALAGQDGVPAPLAELAALGHDFGKLVTFAPAADGWTRRAKSHARMSAVLLAQLPEWQALERADQADLTLAVAFHHDPNRLPSHASLRARSLLRLLREADGLTTRAEEVGSPSDGGARQTTAADVRTDDPTDAASPSTDNGAPMEQAAGGAPESTPQPSSSLEGRLAEALARVLAQLRINTRPFDGLADPDSDLLMVLDHAVTPRLAAELSDADRRTVGLDGTMSQPTGAPNGTNSDARVVSHGFLTLGCLLDSWGGEDAVLWDVLVGRRRWRRCWLLRLNAIPESLRRDWPTPVWTMRVIGPSGRESPAPKQHPTVATTSDTPAEGIP